MTCPDLVLILYLGAAPALAEPPENSPALWEEQALRREAAGDLLGAESALRHCWKLAPAGEPKSVALANLLSFLVRMGRMGEAGRLAQELATALDSISQETTASASARNCLGSYYQQAGDAANAVLWLRQAHSAAVRTGAALESRAAIANNLSAALLDREQPAEALALLEQTLGEPGLAPEQRCLTRANLAAALTAAGRREPARRALNQVFAEAALLTLAVDDQVRLHQLGSLLLRRLGDKREARLHARQASALEKGLLARSGAAHRVDVSDFPHK